MNDPNKVISVNLSSLLSLKAELLRKQAEVSKAKVSYSTSTPLAQEYVSHKTQKVNENADDIISTKKKDKKRRAKEIQKEKGVTVCELEDSAMLEKSQKVLEAKAKFYERMQKTGGKLNSDDNCLVMFNKKKQEDTTKDKNALERQYKSCSEDDDSSEDDNDDVNNPPEDPEDEWVEYTDCLGRTRTCLKRDLIETKRKDEKLAASMPERLDQTKANWMIDTKGSQNVEGNKVDDDNNDEMIGPIPPQSLFGDGLSIMSKHEEQKANWERKEQENLDKTDVHYQDVFFDEARQHGVGYYAFSTDEEERKKQQKELEKARQQTLGEQQRREALKAQREKIIAERVLAAKNRQRARLGLPPLEKEEQEKKEDEKSVKETKDERKARKKAEKLEKKRLKEEEDREKERLNYIRPWDKEKEGITHNNPQKTNGEEEWQYKPEREPMTQDQWNEYKRNERINEFAPPPQPPQPEKPLKRTNFKSNPLYSTNNYNNVPPPDMDIGFSKFQSTKQTKTFKRRNYTEQQNDTTQHNDELCLTSNLYKTGVCIPPPSNLEDFHLPSHNKKQKSTHELEKSIEAGLRFLRNNCDKEMPATKSSWTAKADY